MEQKLLQSINTLTQEQHFDEAIQIAIEQLHQYPANQQLWLQYTSALISKNLLLDALETLNYLRLLNPLEQSIVEKINRIEQFQHISAPKKYNFLDILKLDVPTLGIAMIVKNEIDFLPAWYESIQSLSSEIVVVDTGSTDGSIEYLQSLPKVKLLHFEWIDDFSAAKNYALQQIQSEWVLFLDADEQVHLAEVNNTSVQFLISYFNKLNNPVKITSTHLNIINDQHTEYTYDQVRLFKKDEVYYEGKIHEQLINRNQDLSISVVRSGLKIIHYGYEEEIVKERKKFERNVALLKEQVLQQPNNIYWYTILGRDLRYLKHYEEAINYLQQALAITKPSLDISLIPTLDELAKCYTLIGDMRNLILIGQQLIQIDETYPNGHYYYHYANIELSLQSITASYNSLDTIKNSFQHYSNYQLPDPTIFNWKIDYLKANVLKLSGYLPEAYKLYKELQPIAKYDQIDQQLSQLEQHMQKIKQFKL